MAKNDELKMIQTAWRRLVANQKKLIGDVAKGEQTEATLEMLRQNEAGIQAIMHVWVIEAGSSRSIANPIA